MKKKHVRKADMGEEVQPIDNLTTSSQPSMLSRVDSLLNIFIVIGILAVVGIGGYLAVTRLDLKLPSLTDVSSSKQLPAITFDKLTIKTDLAKEKLEPGVAFLKTALRSELFPDEISLQTLGQQPQGGETSYVGSWNKNGTFVSFLAGVSPQQTPGYFRVWMMPQGESVTLAQAQELLKGMISEQFLSMFTTPLACRQLTAQDNSPVTECATMKTTDTGDLVGLTVRAPIILEPPPEATVPTGVPKPKVTIVSACMIPKDATSVYPAGSCI